jgi:hypothetical protein
MAWCEDLHPENVEWLHMLIERDLWYLSEVIVSVKELVHRCLNCDNLEVCDHDIKQANLKFLEHNEKQHG